MIYYVFNKEGRCVATMKGARPSQVDLDSRGEFVVEDSVYHGGANEVEFKDGNIQKIREAAE